MWLVASVNIWIKSFCLFSRIRKVSNSKSFRSAENLNFLHFKMIINSSSTFQSKWKTNKVFSVSLLRTRYFLNKSEICSGVFEISLLCKDMVTSIFLNISRISDSELVSNSVTFLSKYCYYHYFLIAQSYQFLISKNSTFYWGNFIRI